jgi:hypothetical protein
VILIQVQRILRWSRFLARPSFRYLLHPSSWRQPCVSAADSFDDQPADPGPPSAWPHLPPSCSKASDASTIIRNFVQHIHEWKIKRRRAKRNTTKKQKWKKKTRGAPVAPHATASPSQVLFVAKLSSIELAMSFLMGSCSWVSVKALLSTAPFFPQISGLVVRVPCLCRHHSVPPCFELSIVICWRHGVCNSVLIQSLSPCHISLE